VFLLLLALFLRRIRLIVAAFIAFNRGYWIGGVSATLETRKVTLKHVDLSFLLELAHWLVLLGLRRCYSAGRDIVLVLIIHEIRYVLLHEVKQLQQDIVRKLVDVQLNLGLIGTLRNVC
jgi:hypothetical protein